MFDPSKHRKTSARLAELKTKAPKEWKVDKPKQGDFIQIYGDTLSDLDLVNLYVQRDGGGYNTEWLIQGDTDKDEEELTVIRMNTYLSMVVSSRLESSIQKKKLNDLKATF